MIATEESGQTRPGAPASVLEPGLRQLALVTPYRDPGAEAGRRGEND